MRYLSLARATLAVWISLSCLVAPARAVTIRFDLGPNDFEDCDPPIRGFSMTADDDAVGIPVGPGVFVFDEIDVRLLLADGGELPLEFGAVLQESGPTGDAFRLQGGLGDLLDPDPAFRADILGSGLFSPSGPDSIVTETTFFDIATLAQAQLLAGGGLCFGDIESASIEGGIDPDPLCSVALMADDDIKVAKDATIQGEIHANDEIVLKKSGTHVVGTMTAVDEIRLGANRVDGDVVADEVEIEDATVNGGVFEDFVSEIALRPVPSDASGAEDFLVFAGQSLVLPAGAYDDVTVKKGGSLELSGSYTVRQLKLAKGATITLGGPTTLIALHKIVFAANARVNAEGAPEDFTIDAAARGTIKIGKDAAFNGFIFAADAKVKLSKGSVFNGRLCVEDIVVDKEALVFGVDLDS